MRKGRFRNSGPPQFTICLNFPANPAGGPSGKSQAGMEIAMPCRGGYHPPVRLCNRRLRGARRLGAPSVGATCGRPLIEDAPLAERAAFLEVASLDFYRKRPRRLRLGRGTAFFPKESGGKERAGGVPPAPPKNGGSWRRWVVRAGQRPGVHCRPLYWRLRHGRCRASGGTHRDYPASLGSGCAVPTWPAGPPSRMPRPTSSAQATDRSLPGKPESSFPPLGLLSPRRPLRWVAAGAPIFTPVPSRGGVTA